MGTRLELHEILKNILGSDNVYFQPPESIKLKYPCIVYNRTGMYTRHADDKLYTKRNMYQVTVIDKNPDSEIPDRLIQLPLIRFNNHFTSDQLNHDVFSIYF